MYPSCNSSPVQEEIISSRKSRRTPRRTKKEEEVVRTGDSLKEWRQGSRSSEKKPRITTSRIKELKKKLGLEEENNEENDQNKKNVKKKEEFEKLKNVFEAKETPKNKKTVKVTKKLDDESWIGLEKRLGCNNQELNRKKNDWIDDSFESTSRRSQTCGEKSDLVGKDLGPVNVRKRKFELTNGDLGIGVGGGLRGNKRTKVQPNILGFGTKEGETSEIASGQYGIPLGDKINQMRGSVPRKIIGKIRRNLGPEQSL